MGAFCNELMCIRSHFYKTDSDHRAPLCLHVCLELNENGDYMGRSQTGLFCMGFQTGQGTGQGGVERGAGQANNND